MTALQSHPLVVGALDPFHPGIVAALKAALPAGWRLELAENQTPASQKQALRDATLCFVMAAPLDAGLIGSAQQLRFIQKLGVGVDRIDLQACRQRGITVARLAGGNDVPVAEHTILMILAALRRLPLMDRSVRDGKWEKEAARGVNRQISGRTVGLVGFGAIGRTVAKMLAGFNVEILYYDPVRAPAEVEARLQARCMDLDPLLVAADIVSLHLPLRPETAGIISRKRLETMKNDAVLINCARGGLVDEDALHACLAANRILAAGLDTFSKEPPAGSPLFELPNTILTPHLAGATLDNFASVAARAVANAQRFLRGEELPAADVVVPPPPPAAMTQAKSAAR